MHLKRWITGLTALPFLILLISKGGSIAFAVFISIVSIIALFEYYEIVLYPQKRQSIKNALPLISYLFGIIIIFVVYRDMPDIVSFLIVFNLIISGFISLFKFKTNKDIIWLVVKQLMGLIYIPLFLSYLILIRNGSDGIAWIYFLLILVFAGDTGAFYAGTYFGKHKLCPSVSPGKTIEGSLGGLGLNIVAGGIFKYYFLSSYSWGISILLFICVGIAGQIGDLFESELKRSAGVKDSGSILPGHGGILDRIDALLFAAPVAWVFKEFLF
ncbi:MAG: phosphatidate cytidylyltransferase [Proteobacteria bacterium]|nr:phosphatidate cytidylyltransferase [Pseudomonadota bacterium]